jgi:signal transduction histidine kinase
MPFSFVPKHPRAGRVCSCRDVSATGIFGDGRLRGHSGTAAISDTRNVLGVSAGSELRSRLAGGLTGTSQFRAAGETEAGRRISTGPVLAGWMTGAESIGGTGPPSPDREQTGTLGWALDLGEGGWIAAVLLLLSLTWCVLWKRISGLEKRRGVREDFARSLIMAQENERKRMAAELHDGLGQNLIIIKNRALLAANEPAENANVRKQLEEITRVAAQTIEEIREISRNLRPYQLDRLGLTLAMRAVVKKTAQSSGIQFQDEIEPVDGIFSQEVEINLYRILQEGLNNVLKHSKARNVRVEFRSTAEGYAMVIADNGQGFDAAKAPPEKGRHAGLGFSIMQERARILNGRIRFLSKPGQGVRLELNLPHPRKAL